MHHMRLLIWWWRPHADKADWPVLAAQVEEDLEKEVQAVTYELEGDLRSFGKGFTVIEQVRLCRLACKPAAKLRSVGAWPAHM